MAIASISTIRHPFYLERELSWFKWRLCFEGGDLFIREFLQRYHKSESHEEFLARRKMTYAPSFAKAAIVEVRNSIYQRLTDITRVGGSPSYASAVAGELGGVDLLGSSMNTFMGTEILEELLVMGKVGVYIDMPPVNGPTLADNLGKRPYLYAYRCEDIRSWIDDDTPERNEYKALLLRDYIPQYDDTWGLPMGQIERYRYLFKDDNGEIWVQFYDTGNNMIDVDGLNGGGPYPLKIDRIPFVPLELNNSLMCDIANYQIALLNLASTDMAYATGANFPFYTEQFDSREQASHLKIGGDDDDPPTEHQGGVVSHGPQADNADVTIQTGPASGRRYGKGLDRPQFIHPSAEPMKASMAKQEQLMKEIRLLINLTIADLQTKGQSAESKGLDDRTLESGLSYIGLIMEDAERQIADIWHQYEKDKSDYTVQYPERYSIRNEKDVADELKQLKEMMSTIPSPTYKKAVAKRIAELLVGNRITPLQLKQLYSEIDKAKVLDILVDKVDSDVTAGFLDPELAAELRGYPEGTVAKAQAARIERIKAVQIAQTAGAGFGQAALNETDDTGANPDGTFPPTPGGAAGKAPANPAARGNPDASTTGDPKADVAKEKAAAGDVPRGKGKNNKKD